MAALEHILLAYVAAWNEADEAKRRTLLETSWAEQGIYCDPTAQVSGREALVQHLGKLLQRFADQRVLLTSGIDEHHGLLQFAWARVGSDGSTIRTGIDFGEVAADGRRLAHHRVLRPSASDSPDLSERLGLERCASCAISLNYSDPCKTMA